MIKRKPGLSIFLFATFSVAISTVLYLIYYLFEVAILGHLFFLLWSGFFLHLFYLSITLKKQNPCPGCGYRNSHVEMNIENRKTLFKFDCTQCEIYYGSFLKLCFPLCKLETTIIAPKRAIRCVNCKALVLTEEILNEACPACYLSTTIKADVEIKPLSSKSLKDCPSCHEPFQVTTRGILEWELFDKPITTTLFYCEHIECRLNFAYRESSILPAPDIFGSFLPHKRYQLAPTETQHLNSIREKSCFCPRCHENITEKILSRDECKFDHELFWCPGCEAYYFFNIIHLITTPINFIQCQECGTSLANKSPIETENLKRCSHCSARLNSWIPEGSVIFKHPEAELPNESIPCVYCRNATPKLLFSNLHAESLDVTIDRYPEIYSKDKHWVLFECENCQHFMKYGFVIHHDKCIIENFKFFGSRKREEIDYINAILETSSNKNSSDSEKNNNIT